MLGLGKERARLIPVDWSELELHRARCVLLQQLLSLDFALVSFLCFQVCVMLRGGQIPLENSAWPALAEFRVRGLVDAAFPSLLALRAYILVVLRFCYAACLSSFYV